MVPICADCSRQACMRPMLRAHVPAWAHAQAQTQTHARTFPHVCTHTHIFADRVGGRHAAAAIQLQQPAVPGCGWGPVGGIG